MKNEIASKHPLRIIHVVPMVNPAAGGLPAVAVQLASAAASSNQVAVAAADMEDHRPVGESVYESIEWRKLTVGTMQHNAVPESVADYDVMHCHGIWSFVTLRAAAKARSAGVPVIVTPHGMLDRWSLRQRSFKKRIALATTHRRYLSDASAIHCLNNDEFDAINELRLRPRKDVIGNGVGLAAVDRALTNSSQSFWQARFNCNGPVVLFLGRLHEKKQPVELAKAFTYLVERLPGVHLAMVGPDDGEAKRVQQVALDDDWVDRLILPGPIYDDDKYLAIRDAAVFVLPSKQEGFSLSILEAMACGTSVVISPGCHFDEVQKMGAGIVVSDQSPDSWANAIESVIGNTDSCREMGQAGRRLIENRYTWESISDQMLGLYRDIIQAAL